MRLSALTSSVWHPVSDRHSSVRRPSSRLNAMSCCGRPPLQSIGVAGFSRLSCHYLPCSWPVLASMADSCFDGRFYTKVCHCSRSGPESAVAASTVVGRIDGEMAEFIRNSAIPSEGSMQTSWPALRNNCCAHLALRSVPAKNPSWPATARSCARTAVGPFMAPRHRMPPRTR